ncbi:MAG: GNAT family N-acetyltransferase [Dichotomicrobium sp.]
MDNRLIRLSGPEDAALIEQLHDEAFGPGRFARAAYRVREQAPDSGFGLTAWRDGALAGSVHFTPIVIGGRGGAMMLGPLAVAPRFKGIGLGRWLVEEGVARAGASGAALVILVGDLPYYARMDFQRIPTGQITLPGPVAPERLLAREIREGVLRDYAGLVGGDKKAAVTLVQEAADGPAVLQRPEEVDG